MILIDDRIGSKEFDNIITSPHTIASLEYGDFCFAGNGKDGIVTIAIERKTLSDFIGSMESGRLSGHQLPGLVNNYDYVYILIEGLWQADKTTGILMEWKRGRWKQYGYGRKAYMTSYIWGYLNSLILFGNVIIQETGNKHQTGLWVDGLYNWWEKEWDSHSSYERCEGSCHMGSKGIGFTRPNLVHKVAMCFDGVGWDRGKKIGEMFGSVREFIDGYERIVEIKSIGKKVVKNIEKQLYGSD